MSDERSTPTQVLMRCMESFSTAEPDDVVVLFTNEKAQFNVSANVDKFTLLGMLEFAKQAILSDSIHLEDQEKEDEG